MHAQQGTSGGGSAKPLAYPTHRVSGAVPAGEVDAVREALAAAGFGANHVEVLAGDADAQRFHDIADMPGVWGAVRRFALSLGRDLDLAREAEEELRSGDALVEVTVHDDAEKRRVRDVLLQHGGHFITYFGNWTIETLA